MGTSPRPPASLRGLLDVASALRSEPDVHATLHAIARSIGETLGWSTVVVNLHRPAWADFEVVVVHGDHAARDALLGTTNTAAEWAPLLDERYLRGSAYFIPHGSFDWSSDVSSSYVPHREPLEEPDAWHPDDALFIPLRGSDGSTLGILSIDEPATGLRPSDAELEVLGAVAVQAGLAIELAQRAETVARRGEAVQHLLRVSAGLVEERALGDILEAVCTGVQEALGFQTAAVFLLDDLGEDYVARAATGFVRPALERFPALPAVDVAPLLAAELESDGCVLLERDEAWDLLPRELRGLYESRGNGRGPQAWNNHWLLVPLHDRTGGHLGVLWVDDPLDRLRPSREKLQALRTFANQAAGALAMAQRLESLAHLAEHDPLTGLRNRRNLADHIDARIAAVPDGSAALIVFDVDSFKRINDVLGYELGDDVLRGLGRMIAGAVADGGLAARLGGEEFALLVPGASEAEALAAAESVRAATRLAFPRVPWGLTLSAGVAATGPEAPGADALLRSAGRALFAAKRLGRDRAVVYHAEALEELLGTLGEDRCSAEQVAAMILLAEMLDLRDPGTARHSQTVGRYAENVARALEWTPERVERMRIAGVLHDIGKLGISDAVLHKAGALTPEEWADIRRHSELGSRILDHANLRDVGAWVLAHHERMDGRGYPHGISGHDIPIEARILAVADAYEAMTADRPYRRALPHAEAQAELRRHAGTQFDPAIVRTFLDALERERRPAPPAQPSLRSSR